MMISIEELKDKKQHLMLIGKRLTEYKERRLQNCLSVGKAIRIQTMYMEGMKRLTQVYSDLCGTIKAAEEAEFLDAVHREIEELTR